MKKQAGFTLIELVVVMAIIALLTGLVAFNFQQARQKARDVQRKNDIKNLQKSLELYRLDQNLQRYPASLSSLVSNYMNELPMDPKYRLNTSSWVDYVYVLDPSDSLKYRLDACLENAGDFDKLTPTTTCPTGINTGVIYRATEP